MKLTHFSHFWLKFIDMLLFTMCVVTCVYISNIEVFEIVLYYCHRVTTQLQLINISISMSKKSLTLKTSVLIFPFTFFYIFM